MNHKPRNKTIYTDQGRAEIFFQTINLDHYLEWNPDPTTMMLRFEGKYYKFDAEGNPYRFYPPGMKKPRTKTDPKT